MTTGQNRLSRADRVFSRLSDGYDYAFLLLAVGSLVIGWVHTRTSKEFEPATIDRTATNVPVRFSSAGVKQTGHQKLFWWVRI